MEVLIVEDDPISAMVLKQALILLGHSVVSARNGNEALVVLDEQRFVIIISDWMMPHMDGLELCRRVRAAQNGFYTYFILMSSKDTNADRIEALRAGVDDFLVKSMDSRELYARLNVAQRILNMQEENLRHSQQLIERQAELASLNLAMSEQATIDSLTELKNHGAFYEELERAYNTCVGQGEPLALLLLDIDEFKHYNDTHGHLAGDEILRQIGKILRSNAREHDFVARYGGEEFAIILPHTEAGETLEIAERFRFQIESHPWPMAPITTSIGISFCNWDIGTTIALVHQADQALYASKSAGRNCCTRFTSELSMESARQLRRVASAA